MQWNKSKRPRRAALNRDVFKRGMRVVARSLKPHKRMLIILTVFGLANAAAQAFIPLVSGRIFDGLIGIAEARTALSVVFTLIAIWLVLQVTSNALDSWSGYENSKLGVSIEAEHVASGMGRLFLMPLSFHASQKQGEVGDRITRAASWLDNIVANVLLTLLPNFLSIVIALAITLLINSTLTLVLMAAIAVYGTVLWRAIPRLAALQKKVHRAYSRAYGGIYDSLGNVREIKQAATEREEQRKIRRNLIGRAVHFWLDVNGIFARLSFFQKIVVTATQLAIFAISVFYVRAGLITPGELVAFNGYAAMILGPFVILGQNWQTIQNGLVAIVRAEKVLATPAENYHPKGAAVPRKLRGEVAFEQVSFGYENRRRILQNINVHVAPGQKIALVGDSGVGKSTIMDLLMGFYSPQEGRVLIDGIDVRKIDLAALRSRIGVVPQEPTLFNDTIEANIRYGNGAHSRGEMMEAVREAHAETFIKGFPRGYRQIVGWRGVKLSVGQKQRLALARAFLRSPDILILDEPTSALDARSEHLIKESLKRLMAGRTTFIIAHRLSTVREADQILVLRSGHIVEYGRHEDLMRIPEGVYRSLTEFQSGTHAGAEVPAERLPIG